jgi:hypothetical protein
MAVYPLFVIVFREGEVEQYNPVSKANLDAGVEKVCQNRLVYRNNDKSVEQVLTGRTQPYQSYCPWLQGLFLCTKHHTTINPYGWMNIFSCVQQHHQMLSTGTSTATILRID